jgi:hypothetical protein
VSARVVFGLALGRLVGSAWPETAPATVGGEEGGGRPPWSQCRRAGGSACQCTYTGGSKRCGWRLMWCLNSRMGGGQWGAPASFGRLRRRARWGGPELRPSECEGGGSAWHAQEVGAPRLGPPGGQLPCRQRGQGARARSVYAGTALLLWRGRRALPAARGHLAGCGGGRQHVS